MYTLYYAPSIMGSPRPKSPHNRRFNSVNEESTNKRAGAATSSSFGGRRRAPSNANVAISFDKQKSLSKFSAAKGGKQRLERGGVEERNTSLSNVVTLSDLAQDEKRNSTGKSASKPTSALRDTRGNSLSVRKQKHSPVAVVRNVPTLLDADDTTGTGSQIRSPQKADRTGRRLDTYTVTGTGTEVPNLNERRKVPRPQRDRFNTCGVGKALQTTTYRGSTSSSTSSESHTKCQKISVKFTADRPGRRKTMEDDRNSMNYPAGSLHPSHSQPQDQVNRGRRNVDSRHNTGESEPVMQQPTQADSQSDCYQKIAPNASRREKLVSGANKELEEFQKYKASKKLTTITGKAQSTGGAKSMEDARRDMAKLQLDKKYEQIRKREKWRQQEKERKEREYNEKKARAREQTKRNERLREERAARFLLGDHARTNEEFLRRLEDKSASSVPSNSPDVCYSQELQSLKEMFPDKDPAKLQKMLELTNGNVSEVTELLM